jgi:hypothetical protein
VRNLRGSRLELDIVGLGVAGVMYVFSIKLGDPLQDVMIGVATSFVFVAMLDLALAVQANVVDRARVAFFGAELVRRQTTLVYPDFVLHRSVVKKLLGHDVHEYYERPVSKFRDFAIHIIDVPRIVAGNDVQALLYVSSIFDSTSGNPNIMVVDTDMVENCDRSFISFGLYSNDCTLLYVMKEPTPLFKVVPDGSGFGHIELRDGRVFRTSTDRQYAIIARHASDRMRRPERRWFICGGLGPVGTTAAGWYLWKEWRSLARKVPASRDFVAVLYVGPWTHRTPVLECILIDDDLIAENAE